MKGNYKRFQSWCDVCDKSYVANGKKCFYCKNKQYAQSKLKKPHTIEILNNEICHSG